MDKTSFYFVFGSSLVTALFSQASLLFPVFLVFFGLASSALGGSVAETLYGTYRWVFRVLGFLCMILLLLYHCYFHQRVKSFFVLEQRREEIFLVLCIGLLAYVVLSFVLFGLLESFADRLGVLAWM